MWYDKFMFLSCRLSIIISLKERSFIFQTLEQKIPYKLRRISLCQLTDFFSRNKKITSFNPSSKLQIRDVNLSSLRLDKLPSVYCEESLILANHYMLLCLKRQLVLSNTSK